MQEQEIIQLILALVKNAMSESEPVDVDCTDIRWEDVFEIAIRNQLIPFLYDPVERLAAQYPIPKDLLRGWKQVAIRSMLEEYDKYRALKLLLHEAEKENIKFIIFKGAVLASLYPKYYERFSSDTDIFVYQKDKDKAVALFERMGYVKSEAASKESVFVYHLRKPLFVVELHFSLWEDYTGTKISLMEEMNLTDEATLIRVHACGINMNTLGYEEHLIFQMIHIIKHFSLQGVSVRYLVDVTLYINQYGKQIDFNSFWRKMKQLSYGTFCDNFFCLCIHYLGLSPDIMKGREGSVIGVKKHLILDMIQVGMMFADKQAGWQLLGLMTPYFTGEAEIPKTKFKRKLVLLFPKSKNLPEEYAYAKRHPFLLPVAWIHKLLFYLIKWHKNKNDWYNAREKLTIAEHRLALLQNLGLVERGE